jgi:hypothetical protein
MSMTSEGLTGILLLTDEDVYHSWLLTAFVPWADIVRSKGIKRAAEWVVKMARESIKADNRFCDVLEGAVKNREEILAQRDRTLSRPSLDLEKRALNHPARGELGMAVRRWGRHWRLHMIFAMLVEIASASEADRIDGKKFYN